MSEQLDVGQRYVGRYRQRLGANTQGQHQVRTLMAAKTARFYQESTFLFDE